MIRTLFLLAAIVLFILAVFIDEKAGDLMLWGLAAFAASFIPYETYVRRAP